MSKNGIGVSSLRKEDDRYLRGRGEFVGDIQLPGLRHVAFLRSPIAHGRLGNIVIPDSVRKQVFLATDLKQVAPIRARSALPGFKASDQPVLATTKVRHVGELIAMCVADTRAQAEDIADAIEIEIAELPVVSDMLAGREDGSALVHEEWGDNLFLTTNLNRISALLLRVLRRRSRVRFEPRANR